MMQNNNEVLYAVARERGEQIRAGIASEHAISKLSDRKAASSHKRGLLAAAGLIIAVALRVVRSLQA